MREIKFRVWDIYKKVFIPENVYAIKNIWSAFWIMTENWENYSEGEVFFHNMQTISQYTWLLDKNGKEIYEWDVLRIQKSHLKDHKIVECIWWNIWWWLFQQYKSPYSLIDSEEFSYYESEVIWNIYENKKLLIN